MEGYYVNDLKNYNERRADTRVRYFRNLLQIQIVSV